MEGLRKRLPLATSWKAVFRNKTRQLEEEYINFGQLLYEDEVKERIAADMIGGEHLGRELVRVFMINCHGDNT